MPLNQIKTNQCFSAWSYTYTNFTFLIFMGWVCQSVTIWFLIRCVFARVFLKLPVHRIIFSSSLRLCEVLKVISVSLSPIGSKFFFLICGNVDLFLDFFDFLQLNSVISLNGEIYKLTYLFLFVDYNLVWCSFIAFVSLFNVISIFVDYRKPPV